MPDPDQEYLDADLLRSGEPLVQLGPGMYADETDAGVLIIHLGEVIRSRGLDDTQETRASIYGAWAKFCTAGGVLLVLIRELDVPSVRDPDCQFDGGDE